MKQTIRKSISLLLTLCMVLSLCSPALAAEAPAPEQTTQMVDILPQEDKSTSEPQTQEEEPDAELLQADAVYEVTFDNETSRGGWKKDTGVGSIAFTAGEGDAGYATISVGGGNSAFVAGDAPSIKNGFVEADITPIGNNKQFGLAFRYVSATSYVAICYDGGWGWCGNDGTKWGASPLSTEHPVTAGTKLHLRIEYVDELVRVLVDNDEIFYGVLPTEGSGENSTADLPTDAGKCGFRTWGSGSQATVKIDNVRMGALTEIVPTQHDVTVVKGKADPTAAAMGTVVSITADDPEGAETFRSWTSSDGVVFDNATNAVTTFKMPAKNVKVTANYAHEYPAGTTFYIDSEGGSDDNNGTTAATAWQTLDKVNAVTLKPGDKVLLKAESVFEGQGLSLRGSGSKEAPIVVDMYAGGTIGIEAGERPHIKANGVPKAAFVMGNEANAGTTPYGSISYGLHIKNVSHIRVNNLEITNDKGSRQLAVGAVVEAESGQGVVSGIHLDNLYVHDVYGDLTQKTAPNGGIYVITTAANGNVAHATRYDGVLIENCTVKDVSRTGISVGSSHSANKWEGHPGGIIPDEVKTNYGHINVVISNNYVEKAGGDAIVPQFCIAPLVESNVSNAASQNTPNGDEMYNAAIWPWRCEDAIFQYNEAYGTLNNGDGQAYDCDFSRGTIYQYNYSHDNEGGFILLCKPQSVQSTVRYNISQNDLDSLFLVSNTTPAEIYNNTFYIGGGLNTNIVAGDGPANLKNNIFYSQGTNTKPSWGNFAYENNLFYGFEDAPANTGKNSGNLYADPKFADPGKGGDGVEGGSAIDTLDGYKLLEGSPAIGAGQVITNNGGKDYGGNAVSDTKKPNMGAFEALSTAVPLVNLALNKPVTGTPEYYEEESNPTAFAPGSAVDGDLNTVWGPMGKVTGEVTIDFGSVQSFNQMVVTTRATDGWQRTDRFAVQISDDNATWTTVCSQPCLRQITTLNLSRRSARYVRLQVIPKAGQELGAIAEVELYQNDAVQDPSIDLNAFTIPGSPYVELNKELRLRMLCINTLGAEIPNDQVDFRFTSSNAAIASVTNAGVVTGVTKGEVTITAKATYNNGKTLTVSKTVYSGYITPQIIKDGDAEEPSDGQQNMIDTRNYGLMMHFGINTFNDTQWSDGTLPISSYAPTTVDADQWARVAKEAGMTHIVLVSQHHDGFAMWDTKETDYKCTNPETGNQTDVIKAVAQACEKYDLQLGLYYSLWNRHETFARGEENDARHVQFMKDQFTELLGGEYGKIAEIWLDGGWDKAVDRWKLPELYDHIKTLQPDCQVGSNHTIGVHQLTPGLIHPSNYKKYDPMLYFPSDFKTWDGETIKDYDEPKIFTYDEENYYLPYEETVCVRNPFGGFSWFWQPDYETYETYPAEMIQSSIHKLQSRENIFLLNMAIDPTGHMVDSDIAAVYEAADLMGIASGAALGYAQPLTKEEKSELQAILDGYRALDPDLYQKSSYRALMDLVDRAQAQMDTMVRADFLVLKSQLEKAARDLMLAEDNDNLALGADVVGTPNPWGWPENPEYQVENTVDGDSATLWGPDAANDATLLIDLGKPLAFHQVRLNGRESDTVKRTAGIDVLIGDTPEALTEILTGAACKSADMTLTFEAQTARYVKVVIHSKKNELPAYKEISVYNAGDKEQLQTLYTQYAPTQNEGYTPDSWAAFQTNLVRAKNILALFGPSAEQMKKAGDALTASFNALIKSPQSGEKRITSFAIEGQMGESTINETDHTIAVAVPQGTDVTSLTPTVAVSARATVDPASGEAKDFTSPVSYTVTAEDGSTRTYTVTVTVETYVPPDTPPSNTITKTEKNEDGSTTKTVTNKKTGNVTETTTYSDGTKVVAVTPKGGKTSIEVTVPKNKDRVTVTIPTPEKPGTGTVAVIVNADGTKTVVKNSVATEGGMTITLAEGAKLEIIDNSKTFADVKGGEWYAEAVQFAASRELFQGVGGDRFDPAMSMNRAMLMTVLYRYEGAVVESEGDTWYADAQKWAVDAGITDGTSPEAEITREQLAAILFRYAKGETTEVDMSGFADADGISDYAKDAMTWAVANGILQGSGSNLNPKNNATRGEVALMLQRFVELGRI